MEFNQLENMIKLSQSDSINQASASLFITQSALNQQLIRLEQELGVKLFNRSRTQITPTESGRVFLDYAKQIIRLKRELINVMGDFSEYKTGVIRLGLPTVRGYDIFTTVFPRFHRQYPHIQLIPLELSVKRQKLLLSRGDIDLAFMTMARGDESNAVFLPLSQEELYLVVPASDPLADACEGDEISLSQAADKNFVLIYRDSTLRLLCDRLFSEADLIPNILLETSNHQTIANLVSKGYACTIAPTIYFQDTSAVRFFHLPGRPSWSLFAAYRKNSHLSRPMRDLLQLVREYANPEETAVS